MTFCGIFPKVKDMPTVSLNFLLPDMPHVCHTSAHVLELHSVPHEVHFWRMFGMEYFTERNGTQEYFTERTIDFTELI